MAEMSYSQQHNFPSCNGHRSGGVALRINAANQLGGFARSRRARHRRSHQRSGRGWLFVSASMQGRGQLRKHLGHRQPTSGDEDQEHQDPQSSGLQFRGPRHARHGRGRLFATTKTRNWPIPSSRSVPAPLGADQLLLESLGTEPARHVDEQEEGGVQGRVRREGAYRDRRRRTVTVNACEVKQAKTT
jgi:hypothetical protein